MTAPIQSVPASSASTAALVVPISLPAVGNTLMVKTGNNAGNAAIASGQGGVTTWNVIRGIGGANDCELWWGVVDGIPSASVTITLPLGRICARVLEWPGILTLDQQAVAFATSTLIDTGPITPTTAGQLVVAVGDAFTGILSGPTGGFTDLGTVTSASFSLGCAYLQEGAPAPAETTWTIASSGWNTTIASFKLPAASTKGYAPRYW